jgi:hypothetical protein
MTISAPQIPVTVPTLVETLAHSMAQKGLTVLATGAVAYGLMAPSQEAQGVGIGLSVVMFALSLAWTWMRSRIDHIRLIDAANAPAADPPLTVTSRSLPVWSQAAPVHSADGDNMLSDAALAVEAVIAKLPAPIAADIRKLIADARLIGDAILANIVEQEVKQVLGGFVGGIAAPGIVRGAQAALDALAAEADGNPVLAP